MAPSATLPDYDGKIEHISYKSTAKLAAARRKAEADFRSDVVTVPTEAMIQVSIFFEGC